MPEKKEINIRYSRQIAVESIGIEGQEALLRSKVLIIGCGALGSMVAMQLAGAGIGNIGIIDYDTIDISNLQRQFFFKTIESGESKVEILGKRIKELNPNIKTDVYNGIMTRNLAEKIFGDYDIIVDATDNPDSKKISGQISSEKGKVCCIGGVRDFSGQVLLLYPGDPRMEDYFGEASWGGFLPCSLGGVMGPSAAFCATLQASEVIKQVIGIEPQLISKLIVFDLADNSFRRLFL